MRAIEGYFNTTKIQYLDLSCDSNEKVLNKKIFNGDLPG